MSDQKSLSVFEEVRSIYSPKLFDSKIVLVTGGSRGIGRAVSQAFGALGAKVIVNFAGNEKAAQETVESIQQHDGQALAIGFNVASFQDTQDTIKKIEKEHGAIDILVNNAGVSKDNLLVRFKEEEWDANLDTNLKGAFHCARAVVMGMMKKRAGKIINISSVVGLAGNAGQCAYSASKSGLLGLSKSLALELAGRNIQVNTIAPGYIKTDMTSGMSEQIINAIMAKIPSNTFGMGVDIAKAVVFLASPAANYVTGQTFAVDGGMTMY